MTVIFEGKIALISEVLTGKDSVAWAGVTMANLHRIAASKTGRCVLHELRHTPRQIKIKPYYDKKDPNNAYAGPVSDRDAYYPYRPIRSAVDGTLDGSETGTGAGSDVTVRYTPWRFAANLQAPTLLHELEHATEQCAGRIYLNALGSQFDTTAEFDAILVENIYRSELGLPSRKNHFDVTTPRNSDHLYPQVDALRRLIESFRARMPKMTSALAGVDTAFNPFRKGAKGYVGA